jgi:hypothetical protein
MTKVELYAVLYLIKTYAAFHVDDRGNKAGLDPEVGSIYLHTNDGVEKIEIAVNSWEKDRYIIWMSYPHENGIRTEDMYKAITPYDLMIIESKIKELCPAVHGF